eukprot:29627-Eustigmatos_ZCMA.PRE.1
MLTNFRSFWISSSFSFTADSSDAPYEAKSNGDVDGSVVTDERPPTLPRMAGSGDSMAAVDGVPRSSSASP